MSLNIVTLMGNLAAVPELKISSTGNPFSVFRVAVNGYNGKTQEQTVDFINCVAFGGTAEFLCKYFTKGSPIAVEGSLHQNDYIDTNGVKHYGYQVTVYRIHFAGRKADNPAAVPAAPAAVQPAPATAPPAPPAANLQQVLEDSQHSESFVFPLDDFELIKE